MSDPPLRFHYAQAVAPLMWAFVALASIELVVVHLLVSMWRGDVAVLLSVATLAAMGWLIHAIWSFRRLPVTLDDRTLVMRVGTIKTVTIPVDEIADVRPEQARASAGRRSVLNLALIAYPNVYIDLRHPRAGRRSIVTVAHRLDDPAAFTSAINRLVAAA